MKTDLKALAETYDLFPIGFQVNTKAILELAAIEGEAKALAVAVSAQLRGMSVDTFPQDYLALVSQTQQLVDGLNARKGAAGEAALRALNLDPQAEDFTIDEDSGEVYHLVRRAPA